ncbi:MAG: hypothetical protein J5874_03575 [Oscillospiraceae bacterium]|nr:hypothetical protein [Oscillospiraceae bacterium]
MQNIAEVLKERFDSDMTEWKPIPFWSWNDKLDPQELCRQIKWMKDVGIGGFFMHARGGLKTEYLSDEWMSCIEAAAKCAKEQGMNAWAYDENGWPSGFAGGKLLEEEENRDCYILSRVGDYDENASVSYLLDGDELVRTAKKNRDGEYLNLYIKVAVSTVDILDPGVVDKFIKITHEAYKARFGERFSDEIHGFFTDEPQYQRAHTPFTRMLYKYFEEQYQEDILDKLGLLFVEKKGYQKFRYRYWKALQHLMIESFAKKIYGWCDKNNVRFTGHYIEETSLEGQMLCCGGIMPYYAYMHMPGIDWLGPFSDNILPPRQLASVASQFGKKHTLSETFACCGWQISPKDLKRIADFQFLGGVNMLCHHLVPYAEHGQRKKDYPAHYSPVNPWVEKEFKDFNTYFTRLGRMLSESEESVNVAVLHPIRSAYIYYKRDIPGSLSELDKNLSDDCKLLAFSGVAFHFLDETLLEEYGFVENKSIGCGEKRYDYLILPHVIAMDPSTEKLLKQYVSNGGKVLVLGDLPTYCNGEEFDFSYIRSNCTLDEIINAQPYKIVDRNQNSDIYTVYRTYQGEPFMMMQNVSTFAKRTLTYDPGENIRSFKKIDLITMKTENISLSVTLDPGESVIVFPDTALPDERPELLDYTFKLDNTEISFEKNKFTVDNVSYSLDGERYSQQYPCAGLFAKLLEDRYEGDIYIKYKFDVRKLPEKIDVLAEECGASESWINGRRFEFTERCEKEKALLKADITDFVREGVNEFVVKRYWYQGENVYYALFGEDVTESLRNCLAYDSELEPIYLSGRFGVFSDSGYVPGKTDLYVYGKDFYIGETPEKVTEPVLEGLPFFAGELKVCGKAVFDDCNVRLRLNGTWHVAYVKINGEYAWKLIYERTLDISKYAVKGENTIEITFIIGNRNLLGPHHNREEENKFISPDSFTLQNSWHNGVSPNYDPSYCLIKLLCK